MTAQIIDGKKIAQAIKQKVKTCVATLPRAPKLVVLLAGDDPASAVYVRNKSKACHLVGIESETLTFPNDVTFETLHNQIEALNADETVDGILLQLPLPPSISDSERQALCDLISPEKDVDGFHFINLGRLLQNVPTTVPCTPKGCMKLIESTGLKLQGCRAVVIGRSVLVSKPLALLLLAADATVTICHSKTLNLQEIVSQADLVVVAVGKPQFVKASWFKPGAVVLDVGINATENGLVGDVEFAAACERVSAISPVPGGVGPMTIACLCENVYEAAAKKLL